MSASTERKIKYSITDLANMNTREFSLLFKTLKMSDMKNILNENGIWVKSTLKSKDICELFLDVVEGKTIPTDSDKKKLQRAEERRNKPKKEVILDEVESNMESLYESFKASKFSMSEIEGLGAIEVLEFEKKIREIVDSEIVEEESFNDSDNGVEFYRELVKSNKNKLERVQTILRLMRDGRKRLNADYRKIMLRIHPDKKNDKYKKYTKVFHCFNEYFNGRFRIYDDKIKLWTEWEEYHKQEIIKAEEEMNNNDISYIKEGALF